MAFFEKDNKGTLQDTVGKADAYWFNRNFGTGKPEPFILYAFKSGDDARKALLSLHFIHAAADSGVLISRKVCHYGCYLTQAGHWEAIIAGNEMSMEDFNKIKTHFIANNGFIMNERAPEEGVEKSVEKDEEEEKNIDLSSVIFKQTYHKPVPEGLGTGQFTYEVYDAPDRVTAIQFLQHKNIDKPLYYLLVDTPEGSFGKDSVGIYDA